MFTWSKRNQNLLQQCQRPQLDVSFTYIQRDYLFCFSHILPHFIIFYCSCVVLLHVLLIDTGKFTLKGADNPGIIHKVTSILAKNGLSIDRMETSDEIAPHGGTTLFKMKGIAHAFEPVASGFDADKIKKDLSLLGDELNCDIDMTDLKPGSVDLA